ncbi:MAG: hypothetical protein FJ027_09985 [Candidatus Rokubacteria bacterium]|nr:hypothetical protein [Candidatus Rokubacteria bacterium]
MPAEGTLAATRSLARYRVTFEALETLAFAEHLRSTLRGAFGHAFRTLCLFGSVWPRLAKIEAVILSVR